MSAHSLRGVVIMAYKPLGHSQGELWTKFSSPNEVLQKEFNLMLNRLEIGFSMIITGSQSLPFGTGKSFCSMRIGELIDKTFNIDKVCFRPSAFLAQQRKIRQEITDANRHRGFNQVIVFDEAAVSLPTSQWHSASNRAVWQAQNVFRDLRSIAILVSADWDWLDNKVKRGMIYKGFCSPSLVGHKEKEYRLYLNRIIRGDAGVIYGRQLRGYDSNLKQRVKVDSFLIAKPSEELVEQYMLKVNKEKGQIEEEAFRMSILAERASGFTQDEQGNAQLTAQSGIDSIVADVIKNPLVQKTLQEKRKLSKSVIDYALLGKNLSGKQQSIITEMVKIQTQGM